MSIDNRALEEMIVESQDYQSDALRDMKAQLDELREVAFERRKDPVNTDEINRYNASRRSFLQRAGLGAGGLATRGIFAGTFGELFGKRIRL